MHCRELLSWGIVNLHLSSLVKKSIPLTQVTIWGCQRLKKILHFDRIGGYFGEKVGIFSGWIWPNHGTFPHWILSNFYRISKIFLSWLHRVEMLIYLFCKQEICYRYSIIFNSGQKTYSRSNILCCLLMLQSFSSKLKHLKKSLESLTLTNHKDNKVKI